MKHWNPGPSALRLHSDHRLDRWCTFACITTCLHWIYFGDGVGDEHKVHDAHHKLGKTDGGLGQMEAPRPINPHRNIAVADRKLEPFVQSRNVAFADFLFFQLLLYRFLNYVNFATNKDLATVIG